ncbi:hypothetical protein K435DRAFT_858796 [Dendrothele bispora CBS 962.96]|uniref:DUF7330 domain-containing protein n=1 Tax=Dendrothele bispora (strain CBS 962.96) TaxID=1314807 RepID=A0A4S8M281_DENBC|nr:hypothetical protein K435DRAFT_858796 [Dendrothele bispora CBS 962.96]
MAAMIVYSETASITSEAPPEYVDTSPSLPPTGAQASQEAQTHALSGTVPPGPVAVATSSKAVNHVSINQPLGSIDCTYIIDPLVQIPKSFLPKLAPGVPEHSRKNLSLRTKVGAIFADVTLWHDDSVQRTEKMDKEGKKKWVNMEMKALVGAVCVKVAFSSLAHLVPGPECDSSTDDSYQRDPTPIPSSERPPFLLRCSTRTGQVFVQLPKTFHGFISITTAVGSVNLSKNIKQTARWVDSGMRKRKCFVGDISRLSDEDSRDLWSGDEVKLETPFGSVDISYIDEENILF